MAHGVVMELTIPSAWWSLKQRLTNMKTVKEPVAYEGIDGKNNVNRAENPTTFMRRRNHSGTSGYQGCLDGQIPF